MRLAIEIAAVWLALNIGFALGVWWVSTRVAALVAHINNQSEEWR